MPVLVDFPGGGGEGLEGGQLDTRVVIWVSESKKKKDTFLVKFSVCYFQNIK